MWGNSPVVLASPSELLDRLSKQVVEEVNKKGHEWSGKVTLVLETNK